MGGRKLHHLPHFNPRSPHGERRFPQQRKERIIIFQSTLPARGATLCLLRNLFADRFQSTLPTRGATIRQPKASAPHGVFQSTLPARGATGRKRQKPQRRRFQSTLPARGATQQQPPDDCRTAISIHAPRTGSDLCYERPAITDWISIHAPRTGSDAQNVGQNYIADNFNPRSPHGERQQRPPLLLLLH